MAKGVFIANTSFAADIETGKKDEEGNPILRRHTAFVGKKFEGAHPLVKLAPDYFDAEDGTSRVIAADDSGSPVEAATAAPGELRNR
jgi:hypothetical protein